MCTFFHLLVNGSVFKEHRLELKTLCLQSIPFFFSLESCGKQYVMIDLILLPGMHDIRGESIEKTPYQIRYGASCHNRDISYTPHRPIIRCWYWLYIKTPLFKTHSSKHDIGGKWLHGATAFFCIHSHNSSDIILTYSLFLKSVTLVLYCDNSFHTLLVSSCWRTPSCTGEAWLCDLVIEM